MRLGGGVLGLLVMGSACAPIYAPPVRTGNFGAPGRLPAGQMEVAAATAGALAPYGLAGANVGYAVRPDLIVQGGVDTGFNDFALAWGGVQLPRKLQLSRRWSLAADLELGLGVGVGGRNDCDDPDACDVDDIAWFRRAAGGGYLGAGGAVRFGPVSLYSRARAQVTDASGLPMTTWVSLFGGFHVHIVDRADVWAGVAGAQYSNRFETARGLATEVGLAFRFDPYTGWRR